MYTPGMWELVIILFIAGVPVAVVAGVIFLLVVQYRRRTKAIEDLAAAPRQQSSS